jgi:hypothetical protein
VRSNNGIDLKVRWTLILKRMGPGSRRQAVIAALLLAVLTASVSSTACGGDPYSGTWSSTMAFRDATSGELSHAVLKIEKAEDGWTVTDALGNSYLFRQRDGGLAMVRNPSGPVKHGSFLKLVGERLVVLDPQGVKIGQFVKD